MTRKPKTVGDRSRSMIRLAQNMLARAKSQDPYVIPSVNEEWWREYYRSMGRILILEWQARYDDRDLSEPILGTYALKGCSEPSCRRSVSVCAWRLWRARRDGRTIVVKCDDHSVDAPERERVPVLVPTRDTDRQLAEIVRLDDVLLRLDAGHPWMMAYARLGFFRRDSLMWQRAIANVRDDLGVGADAAIAQARAAAGTAEYFAEGYSGDEGPPFVVPKQRERETWGCVSDDTSGPDGPETLKPATTKPPPDPEPAPAREPITDFIF